MVMRSVTSTPLYIPSGYLSVAVGNDILWTNPMGIAGIVFAATVRGLQVWDTDGLGVAWLDVKPNEQLRGIIREIPETSIALVGYPRCTAARGDGGPLFVTGETLYRAARSGWIEVVGPLCNCTPWYKYIPNIGVHRKDCPLTEGERAMVNGPTVA